MCRLLYVAIDRVMGYTYAIFGSYKKLNMIEIDKSIVKQGHDLLLKFIYSEKATKFCELSTNYLTGST